MCLVSSSCIKLPYQLTLTPILNQNMVQEKTSIKNSSSSNYHLLFPIQVCFYRVYIHRKYIIVWELQVCILLSTTFSLFMMMKDVWVSWWHKTHILLNFFLPRSYVSQTETAFHLSNPLSLVWNRGAKWILGAETMAKTTLGICN